MSAQDTTIVVAGLAAGGLNVAAQLVNRGRGEHLNRPIIGTFLTVGALLLMANWLPDLAAALALVLFVTSLVMNGRPFVTVLNKLVGD